MKSKVGVFFSIDALIALAIIIVGVLVVYPDTNITPQETFVQSDVVHSLSSVKVGELDNSKMNDLIVSGVVTDLNKSVLQQIGELYVFNESLAKELTDSILAEIDSTENYGIWFGDKLISSKGNINFENAKNVLVERQVISGIKEGESVTAFSSRAFLLNNLQSKYFYFGGYVGEGNISARVEYFGNISSAEMELAISKDFTVYVNDVFTSNFSGSSSPIVPQRYNLPVDNFISGANIVELRGDNLNIAGGFIKIIYSKETSFSETTRYYFPGIDGLINVYDGFYIPGKINSMNVFLHYDNNFTTFLNIGNVTVFNGTTNGEENVSVSNTYLSSILDYDSLSETTIPLRCGIENASYVSNFSKPADVFSVTDLSGSMLPSCSGASWWCCVFGGGCSTQSRCNACGGVFEDKISSAKNANRVFVSSVLNNSQNRVGLVGYRSSVSGSDFHILSNVNSSLQTEINSWSASGGTCICCGINRAKQEIAINSGSDKFKSMVVMSDGEANGQCPEQGTGSARQDAINAACSTYNTYGIRVYAVGFGNDADESTLQSIANCGNGSYYFGSVSNIVEIYKSIAQEIVSASFSEQTLNVLGNVSSVLYPDSYIEFDYNTTAIPYGLVTTSEKKFDDSRSGSFYVPKNSTIIDAVVISYSGSKWTDNLWINAVNIYNLSKLGSNYILLGDPYSINIPKAYIGENNTVNLTTGVSPGNYSEGSVEDKIIYTISTSGFSAYSPLSNVADGCYWNLEFEDREIFTVPIPSEYVGGENCYYTSFGQNISNQNDASQLSVKKLLEQLDYDLDGLLDVKFSEQDLQISSSEIKGIPYDWSTEIQVRIWN